MIRIYAHPEASEEFLRECEQAARDLFIELEAAREEE